MSPLQALLEAQNRIQDLTDLETFSAIFGCFEECFKWFSSLKSLSIVFREFETEKHRQLLDDQSKHLQVELLESTILEMVNHVANSVVKDTAIEKKTGLVKLKHDYQKSQLSLYFKQYAIVSLFHFAKSFLINSQFWLLLQDFCEALHFSKGVWFITIVS